jgi:hypothetical protein
LGLSSPSFRYTSIILMLCFRLICSWLIGSSSFRLLLVLAPLHSVTCLARFCSLGSFDSISKLIPSPLTVLLKLHVLFQSISHTISC